MGGLVKAPRVSRVRQVGTSPIEMWYPLGTATEFVGSTTTTVANQMRAIPFFAPRTGSLDRLAVECTTLAASTNAMVGVCANLSKTQAYPGAFVSPLTGVEVSLASTGMKTLSVTVPLIADELYWAVVWGNSSSPGVRAFPLGAQQQLLGCPSTGAGGGAGGMLFVAQTYASTFPASFPTGAALTQSAPILVFGRWGS